MTSAFKPFINRWMIENPKAVINILHGMSEHGERYEHFAKALNKEGYSVVSGDIRGHGKTAGKIENVGFFSENDGWNLVTQDAIQLTQSIKKETGVPVYIFGHSMGSFIARTVAFKAPGLADGYLLSATIKHPGWKGYVGKPMAKLNGFIFGKKKRSKFLTKTAFQGFSKRIKDKRTGQDWLTRDTSLVEKYINDPYCMQDFTNQFFFDLSSGVLGMCKQENINKVNKETPVYIFAGDMDPAGQYGAGPKDTYQKYKTAGSKDVELKLYEGGRHEMLNETNRDEVYADIFAWLKKRNA